MNKRAIALLGAIFILIIGALGFVLYEKKFKAQPEVKTAEQTSTQEQQQVPDTTQSEQPVNTAPAGKAIKLSEDAVVSPILFFQGNGITYFNKQGQLFL